MYYNNFFEDETVYIGRTEAFYNQDDDDLFYPDLWTWSDNPEDDDFAGEVYELNDDGKEELDWWIECRRMNEYQRSRTFNYNKKNQFEEWDYLIDNFAKRIK